MIFKFGLGWGVTPFVIRKYLTEPMRDGTRTRVPMKEPKEEILINERRKQRQLAVAEALALKYRFEGSFYTFEYGGQCIKARFCNASLQTEIQPFSGYRIELMVPHDILVDGPCVITDIKGHQVNGVASTSRGANENLITIETTVFQPTNDKT